VIPGRRGALRLVEPPADAGGHDRLEDRLSAVLSQMLGCRQPLFTRAGRLFGFRIGWHVYTTDGVYVGCLREPSGGGAAVELFSPDGDYVAELDPDDAERLGVKAAKVGCVRERRAPLPALPVTPLGLYAVRAPAAPRRGWRDVAPPATFVDGTVTPAAGSGRGRRRGARVAPVEDAGPIGA
jgi:hypothetical protein